MVTEVDLVKEYHLSLKIMLFIIVMNTQRIINLVIWLPDYLFWEELLTQLVMTMLEFQKDFIYLQED